MTKLTSEVTNEQAQQLAEEAARLNLPIQELAAQRLFASWTAEAKKEEASTNAPSFEEAMDYVFQKNEELYRRLA